MDYEYLDKLRDYWLRNDLFMTLILPIPKNLRKTKKNKSKSKELEESE